ncbi:hypothetical protein B0H34DRAFT_386681 [Crassisporium funariophilum]|nr:hypothetical protein B0H34DRAFT_386681 [Crassisporium funariophilum]
MPTACFSVVAGIGSVGAPPKSWCNPCRTSFLRSQLHRQHPPPRHAASRPVRTYSRGRKQQASRRRADASPLSNSQALRSGKKRDGASRKVRNVLSRAQAVVVAMGRRGTAFEVVGGERCSAYVNYWAVSGGRGVHDMWPTYSESNAAAPAQPCSVDLCIARGYMDAISRTPGPVTLCTLRASSSVVAGTTRLNATAPPASMTSPSSLYLSSYSLGHRHLKPRHTQPFRPTPYRGSHSRGGKAETIHSRDSVTASRRRERRHQHGRSENGGIDLRRPRFSSVGGMLAYAVVLVRRGPFTVGTRSLQVREENDAVRMGGLKTGASTYQERGFHRSAGCCLCAQPIRQWSIERRPTAVLTLNSTALMTTKEVECGERSIAETTTKSKQESGVQAEE